MSHLEKKNLSITISKRISQMLIKSAPFISMVYFQFAAILICGGIGFFLDDWRNSFPFFFTVGLGIGIIIGLYNMGRIILRGK